MLRKVLTVLQVLFGIMSVYFFTGLFVLSTGTNPVTTETLLLLLTDIVRTGFTSLILLVAVLLLEIFKKNCKV